MPAVDEVMRRSLRSGIVETVARSVRAGLGRRDVLGDVSSGVNDFKTAISSWDNCMAVTICKWPLIAIIIVGGLIVGSILWCIIRRICCGLACCCSCFNCFKCCGNCCGCCDPPKKRNAYMEDSYRQTGSTDGYNYGYKTQPPMMMPAVATAPPPPNQPYQQSQPSQPQYAQYAEYAEFDTKRSGNEDSLPAMPSWENAASKQVLVQQEEVELEQLKKPEPAPMLAELPAQNMALMAGANGGRNTPTTRGQSPANPQGPYGRPLERSLTGGSNFAPHPPQRSNTFADPYSNANANHNDPYGYNGNPQYAASMSTGIADQYPRPTTSHSQAPGRQTPVRGYDGGYGMPQDRGYGDRPAPAFNGYPQDYPARQDYQQGYGQDYQQDYPQDYPQDQGYDMPVPRPAPSRAFTSDSGRPLDHRPLERQYTAPVAPSSPRTQYAPARSQSPQMPFAPSSPRTQYAPARSQSPQMPFSQSSPRAQYAPARSQSPPMPFSQPSPPGSPNLVNNAGFDFNSGFSRPQTPKGPMPSPLGPSAGPGPSALGRQPTFPQASQPSQHNNGGYSAYNSYDRDELHGV